MVIKMPAKSLNKYTNCAETIKEMLLTNPDGISIRSLMKNVKNVNYYKIHSAVTELGYKIITKDVKITRVEKVKFIVKE